MRRSIWTSALPAVVALVAGACSGVDPDAGRADVAVVLTEADMARAEVDTVGLGAVLTGTLEPYRRVVVRAQVPGLLSALAVDRGDPVTAGEVLARIDADGIREQAVSARAAVVSANSRLAVARRQFESARRLHTEGALAELELREAEANLEVAEAEVAAARAQEAAAVESAARTLVRAPVTGRVSERSISEGEVVSPGESLLTVVSTDTLELAGEVPVSLASGVGVGQPVEFTIEEYPGRTFAGTVSRVDPGADPSTRRVGVYARLANPGGAILSGVFATGRVRTGEARRIVRVPAAAVRTGESGPYVWAVEGGRAVQRPVSLGEEIRGAGAIEVQSGLAGGERVVVAPGALTPGVAVQVSDFGRITDTGEEGDDGR